MRSVTALIALAAITASAQQPFTLQQILSTPYSTQLTAAPLGARFAWVENAEGVHNLYIGGPSEPGHALTHYTDDDAQDIASLAWSPDGATLAYVYGAEIGNSGRPVNPAHLQRPTALEIVLQPTNGGPATHLGEGRAPLFSRDGNTLFFIRGGQIWFIANPIHAEPKPCPPSPAPCELPISDRRLMGGVQLLYDRGTPSSLTLSPDGKTLAYISHRRTHSFLALFNLETETLTFPAASTGSDAAPAFSRDGKYLAWLRYPFTDASEFTQPRTSPNPWSIQILNTATKETHTLFQPEANKPGSVEPRMSTGEPHLLWTGPLSGSTEVSSQPERSAVERPAVSSGMVLFFSEADGWVHLYSIDPTKSGKPTLVTPGAFEVEDASLTRDGRLLLWSSNSGGPPQAGWTEKNSIDGSDALNTDRRHICTLDLTSVGSTEKCLTRGVGIESRPVSSADGTALAALVSTVQRPMHAAIVQRDGSTLELRKAPSEADYPAAKLLTPQQVIFSSSDKLFQLHGQLFMPKTSSPGKHPAILFFHGGPKRQMLLGYPAMDYYSNAYAMNQYLASRGYIVLSVNYRGGIGYGLDFRQCQHCGGDGAAEYADALGAAAYLRSRPDVDAAHIGIWGGSYGGYFTALALARNSDIFAAGVDFHGVHEWAREDNASADWLRSSTGDPAEISRIAALAHASSPMADIDKWRSPILLIHGDDDPDVAYIQTPLLADALRARNVHVEELIFPDELHGFVLHRDWLAAYEAAANFFDRMLKPSAPSTH